MLIRCNIRFSIDEGAEIRAERVVAIPERARERTMSVVNRGYMDTDRGRDN